MMQFHSIPLHILLTASFSFAGVSFGFSNQYAQAQNAIDIPVIPPASTAPDSTPPASTAPDSTPPASTYKPGPWQPIARINPSQPVTVNIINQTTNILEIGLTTGLTNTKIQPGATHNIGVTALNSDLVINSATEAAILDYQVETNNNLITVIVKSGSGVAGDNAINIQSNGGIYIY